MRIRLSTDLLTGLMFLALGGFAIAYGWQYPVGSASRMGPGYYPMLASSGLVLIGLVLVIRSFISAREEVGTINVRPLFFVLIGTLAFGLLIERAGLLVAGLSVVFAARLADREFRPVEVTVLAVIMLAFATGLFAYALSLPLRLLPF